MIKCPMCRDLLPDSVRQCRKCQTDLTLLADWNCCSNMNATRSRRRASSSGRRPETS